MQKSGLVSFCLLDICPLVTEPLFKLNIKTKYMEMTLNHSHNGVSNVVYEWIKLSSFYRLLILEL